MKQLIRLFDHSRKLANRRPNALFYSTNKPDSSDIFATNSNVETSQNDMFEITANIPEAEESMEKEQKFRMYVERMRDVSRFSKYTAEMNHRKKMPTYSDSEASYLKDPKYYRKIFARFGKASGIDPGVSWPSKTELQQIIKEEKEYDLTLKQKIDIFIQRKQNELNELEKMYSYISFF
jgi:hypothetical protein